MTPQTALAVNKTQLDSDGKMVKVSIAAAGKRMLSTGDSVPEEKLVQKIQGLSVPSSGLLPPSLLWVSSTGRQCIFQRPPRRVNIEFTAGTVFEAHEEGAPIYEFDLPLPWTIYACTFDRRYQVRFLELYCSPQQITQMGQYLSLMPLPNLYADGKFCLPAYVYDEEAEDYWDDDDDEYDPGTDVDDAEDVHKPHRPNLASAIMSAYQKVWSSNFNMDTHDAMDWVLMHGMPQVIFNQGPIPTTNNGVIKMFKRWESLTLDHVVQAQDWPHKTSVGHVVSALQQANNQQYNGYWLATQFGQLATEIRTEAKAAKGSA
jgi:hypothetical protein